MVVVQLLERERGRVVLDSGAGTVTVVVIAMDGRDGFSECGFNVHS